MGHEDRHLRRGRDGHLHGTHHSHHLRTMVRLSRQLLSTLKINIRRALCSDLVYVILFPQLLCVVHFPDWCNTYGSLFSYCLGLSIRVTGGESLVGLPPLIHFPGFQEPTQEEVTNIFSFLTENWTDYIRTLSPQDKIIFFIFRLRRPRWKTEGRLEHSYSHSEPLPCCSLS